MLSYSFRSLPLRPEFLSHYLAPQADLSQIEKLAVPLSANDFYKISSNHLFPILVFSLEKTFAVLSQSRRLIGNIPKADLHLVAQQALDFHPTAERPAQLKLPNSKLSGLDLSDFTL